MIFTCSVRRCWTAGDHVADSYVLHSRIIISPKYTYECTTVYVLWLLLKEALLSLLSDDHLGFYSANWLDRNATLVIRTTLMSNNSQHPRLRSASVTTRSKLGFASQFSQQ